MRQVGNCSDHRWHHAAMLAFVAMIAGVALAASADNATDSRVPMPKPVIAAEAGGKCVEDTAFMRRNHMELLKHHRDQTVHEGIRTTQHSLANCIGCHASKETGRVTGSKDAFCEGCHTYAAVKLDCFECHTDRARPAVASATPAAGLRP
jgi:hypothetical protein